MEQNGDGPPVDTHVEGDLNADHSNGSDLGFTVASPVHAFIRHLCPELREGVREGRLRIQ